MIEIRNITIPQLTGKKTRRCYIYLPASYRREHDRRYPVLYMFDGHNVFYDSHATYGKCWGMKEYLESTRKQLIVVAIECNHEGNRRLQEYSPFDVETAQFGRLRGQGRSYMNWLTGTLKPMIDEEYRTLPDRDNTLICGSSMGGLMALYGAVAYNRYFRRAACLSPSLWLSPAKVMELVAKSRIANDTCIYMDYGAQEMFNHDANTAALTSTVQLLLAKRVDLTFRVVPGGTHSEASWEQQIPIFMQCLGL